jgi:hypothetical protein
MLKDQVDRAIERVAVGRHNGDDVRLLRRQMEVLPVPGLFRVGPGRLAVDHVQVGDQHFYSLDAVRIRAVLDDIARPRPNDAKVWDPRWGGRAHGTGLVTTAAGLALMALAVGVAGGLDEINATFAGEGMLLGPGLALIAAGAILLQIARVLRDSGDQ